MPESTPGEPDHGLLSRLRGGRDYWLLALPFLPLAIYLLAGHPLGYDERIHFSAARQFYEGLIHPATFPAVLKDYDSTAGPLTFVIWALWGAITGFSLTAMRLLVLAVSFVDVLILYRIAREQKASAPLAVALLLLFSPYFFLTSFMCMTQNFAMVFGLAALLFALRGFGEKRGNLLAAMGFATAATLSRQVWLFLLCAIACLWLFERARQLRGNGTRPDLRRIAGEAVVVAVPWVIVGALFLYWGGFVNVAWRTRFDTEAWRASMGPDYPRVAAIQIRPAFVNFVLLFTGTYFGAALFLRSFNWKRSLLVPLLLAPLFLIFPPRYEFGGGIILQISASISGTRFPWGGEIFLGMLWAVGTAALAGLPGDGQASISLEQRRSLWLLALALFFFVLINMMASRVWERYMIEAVPFLALLLFTRIDRRRVLLWAWIAVLAGVTVVYAYYKCEVQGGGRFF